MKLRGELAQEMVVVTSVPACSVGSLVGREHLRQGGASDARIDLRDRCNTVLRDTTPEGTPVPYMIGALLCERIIRTEGTDALLKAMVSSEDHWAALRPFGITPENLTVVLNEELERPIAFTL